MVETGQTHLLITTGAPESVLACCNAYELKGQSDYKLDQAAMTRCQTTFEELSKQGFRVLAVAYRTVPAQASYTLKDEADLTLVGFLAFFDFCPDVSGSKKPRDAGLKRA